MQIKNVKIPAQKFAKINISFDEKINSRGRITQFPRKLPVTEAKITNGISDSLFELTKYKSIEYVQIVEPMFDINCSRWYII